MSQVEAIKAKVSLVDTLGALGVVNKGRDKCLCPLHPDKTPSFSYNDSGLWYCFVCGVGGDMFELVMRHENLTFKESLSWFNDRFNLGLADKRFKKYRPSPMTEALKESYFALRGVFNAELSVLQASHRALMRLPDQYWNAKDYTFWYTGLEQMDRIEEKLKALEHARYSVRS
jgi:DNA primase